VAAAALLSLSVRGKRGEKEVTMTARRREHGRAHRRRRGGVERQDYVRSATTGEPQHWWRRSAPRRKHESGERLWMRVRVRSAPRRKREFTSGISDLVLGCLFQCLSTSAASSRPSPVSNIIFWL